MITVGGGSKCNTIHSCFIVIHTDTGWERGGVGVGVGCDREIKVRGEIEKENIAFCCWFLFSLLFSKL